MKIDEEFKNLIPPLKEDELKQLEENILIDGVRDSLVVWDSPDGNRYLIDGHNRWNIIQKHNLAYNVRRIEFDSREEVLLWIIDNQLGKRNLQSIDAILLNQKKGEIIQKMAKDNQVKAGKEYGKGIAVIQMDKTYFEPIHTQKEIAKLAGVGSGTVARVEQIQKKAPELIDKVRNGEMTINSAYQTVVGKPESKSVKQIMREKVETAKAEVEDFKEKKTQHTVSIKDVKNNDANIEMLVYDFYDKTFDIYKQIYKYYDFAKSADIQTLMSSDKQKAKQCTELLEIAINELIPIKEAINHAKIKK